MTTDGVVNRWVGMRRDGGYPWIFPPFYPSGGLTDSVVGSAIKRSGDIDVGFGGFVGFCARGGVFERFWCRG